MIIDDVITAGTAIREALNIIKTMTAYLLVSSWLWTGRKKEVVLFCYSRD